MRLVILMVITFCLVSVALTVLKMNVVDELGMKMSCRQTQRLQESLR
jgi:hypothetical protein